jgi:hypothetical protein
MNLTSDKIKYLHLYNKNDDSIDSSNYKIISIDENSFKKFYCLQSIILKSCGIKMIKNEFKHLQTLVELNLYSNQIESLDETTFIGTDQLSILNLSKNKIKTLPRNLFKDMINLNEINFSGNNISNLDMNVFNHLTSLTNFNVSNNNIKAFQSFEKLISLVTINLSWNLIEEIKQDSFKNLVNLINIDLNGNKISKIDRNAFSGLNRLVNIYMHSHKNRLNNRIELNLEESVKYISFKDTFENNKSLISKKNNIFNELKSSINDLKLNKKRIIDKFDFSYKNNLKFIKSIVSLINNINNKEKDLIQLIYQLKDIEKVLNQNQIDKIKIKEQYKPLFCKLNHILKNAGRERVEPITEADFLIEKYKLVLVGLFDQKNRIDKLAKEIENYNRYFTRIFGVIFF